MLAVNDDITFPNTEHELQLFGTYWIPLILVIQVNLAELVDLADLVDMVQPPPPSLMNLEILVTWENQKVFLSDPGIPGPIYGSESL